MAINGDAISKWHASPSAMTATYEQGTGEIRIPLTLYQVDAEQGAVPLVLSRVEAEQLYAAPARALYGSFSGR